MPPKNSPCCPAALSFCAFCARSIAPSSAAITAARLPKQSMAPALISDSSTRLFNNRRSTRSQKSHKLANSVPSARASIIDTIALCPTFLIPASPNPIASTPSLVFTGVKFESLTCTLGGTTGIPISRHSEMYFTTFSGFEVSLVSSAAMNSTG